MENRRRHHNRQITDRRKNWKGSASIVTSLVTGKWNVARKHVTVRTERSKLKTENKRQKTALSLTEHWYARFVGTQATPPNVATRD